MTFAALVDALGREVHWERHSPSDIASIEALLAAFVSADPFLSGAIHYVLDHPDTLDDYLPHMEYPRPFMDKFVLHMDPADRFRIRLHRFRAGVQAGLSSESPTVHDHRWPFTSAIIRGSFEETTFELQPDEGGKWHAGSSSSRTYGVGDVYSRPPAVFHQTVNRGQDPCLTLFVRGRTVLKQSRVWNPETKDLRPLSGRREQIAIQLQTIEDCLLRGDPLLGCLPGAFS